MSSIRVLFIAKDKMPINCSHLLDMSIEDIDAKRKRAEKGITNPTRMDFEEWRFLELAIKYHDTWHKLKRELEEIERLIREVTDQMIANGYEPRGGRDW